MSGAFDLTPEESARLNSSFQVIEGKTAFDEREEAYDESIAQINLQIAGFEEQEGYFEKQLEYYRNTSSLIFVSLRESTEAAFSDGSVVYPTADNFLFSWPSFESIYFPSGHVSPHPKDDLPFFTGKLLGGDFPGSIIKYTAVMSEAPFPVFLSWSGFGLLNAILTFPDANDSTKLTALEDKFESAKISCLAALDGVVDCFSDLTSDSAVSFLAGVDSYRSDVDGVLWSAVQADYDSVFNFLRNSLITNMELLFTTFCERVYYSFLSLESRSIGISAKIRNMESAKEMLKEEKAIVQLKKLMMEELFDM